MAEPVIHHPNRDKPESKAMKAIVVLLLIVSAVLVLIITIGGWSALQGSTPFAFAYALVNLLFAYFVAQWNRGVLPVAAALAVLYAVLALVAAPSWFARDKAGFADPLLDPAMIGMLTVILIPVQLLILVACARAFSQKWNIEIEVDPEQDRGRREPPARGGTPEPLGA